MAMRMMARRLVNPTGEVLLARSAFRRGMSGSGGILEEEEKAAENIYIKKMEQEKLEKLARQGFTKAEAEAAVKGHPDAPPEAVKAAAKASTDKDTNYAVIAGIVGVVAIGYWYFASGSSSKKEKEDKE